MAHLNNLFRHRLSLAALPSFMALALAPLTSTPALAGPKQTTIWQFSQPGTTGDGVFPVAGVVADAQGRLYGTTERGGAICDCGIVYRLTPPPAGQTQWTEEVLHSFNMTDGEAPKAPVLLGADGTIYGTTSAGGAHNRGTVFKIANTAGFPLTILHSFDQSHGGYPSTGLTFGADGLLYGTTSVFSRASYADEGTVYSVSPAGDQVEFMSLAPFGRPTTGGGPSSLTRIQPGPNAPLSDFIGTVDSDLSGFSAGGPDTIFLARANNGSIVSGSIAYTFAQTQGDVFGPIGAPIQGFFGLHGLYFGCALYGGANNHGGVYQLKDDGTGKLSEQIIFSFGPPSAAYVQHGCSLVQGDATGTLYGTADSGGAGAGVLFALYPPSTPGGAWTETDLLDYATNGGTFSSPEGKLAKIGNKLYQTFEYNNGTVAEISP